MSLQSIPGGGVWSDLYKSTVSAAPAFTALALIDASGEKVGFCGRVFTKDHTSKTINKVHFRFGAVTKTGGSTLKVSLQDVSTSTSVMTPDETADQFGTIANADASFASNTWYPGIQVTSDGTGSGTQRTVSPGDRLAVVFEFASFAGSDSVVLSCLASAGQLNHDCVTNLKSGAGPTWAILATSVPNVLLEFTDGTFGTLEGSFVLSGANTHAFKQDTGTADEYALAFQVPFPCKIDAVYLPITLTANTADFDVVIYAASTTVVPFEAADAQSTSPRMAMVNFSEIQLDANTTYYISIRPSQTTTNVSIYSWDVNSASHFQTHALGTQGYLATKLDGGSWSTTTTRRPFLFFRISALDDGVQVGGLLTHPGLAGGMRG